MVIPTLQTIRREHKLSLNERASTAEVSKGTAYLVEIGGSIDLNDAIKILQALSYLTRQLYTLNNVVINIRVNNSYVDLPTLVIPVSEREQLL